MRLINKMKHICPVLFLLIFPLLTRSQGLYVDSTRFVTGINPATEILYAIPTADSGILFVGAESGNPGGIIPYFPIDPIGSNVLVGKINSSRQISWIKVYGCSAGAGARSACQTRDGGYAVLCNVGSDDGEVTGYKGNGDMWLIRLDDTGKLLWENCYGTSQQDGAMSIANTPDNGFIMLGATNGSDGDAPNHYGGFYGIDWLVIKTDSVGNRQWSKDLGTSNDEGESGSIFAIDTAYYLVSATETRDHDCTDSNWHPGVLTSYDVYVLKLDDTGRVLWDSSYGGSGADNAINAIYDTRDSTIVIAGTTNSTDYMVTDYHGGNDDIWAIKVNKNGTLLWQKTLGTNQEEDGTGICAAHNSGYIVYGKITTGPIGGEDCWLSFLGNYGNEITSKIFGGSNEELPGTIIPLLNGYAATGISASTVFTEGATNGRNCSGEEAFISYLGYGLDRVPALNIVKPELKTFPNPSNNNLFVHLPDVDGGSLFVLNNLGIKVKTQIVEQGIVNVEINVNGWMSGTYLIVWRDNDGSVLTSKFAKD